MFIQQVAIAYVQLLNCARDAQFRNWPGKLVTTNLRNAVSKLRKLPKSAEHIRCQMCGKCSHINSLHSLWTVTKNDLSSLNNLFMAKFQLIRMSSYAKNKLQMCSVTQHQCRRRQMCGKCSHINSLHSLLDSYKKRLVITEQSIHGKVSTHLDVLLC